MVTVEEEEELEEVEEEEELEEGFRVEVEEWKG